MYYYLLTTIKINLSGFQKRSGALLSLFSHKEFEWNYFITLIITIIFLIKFSLPFLSQVSSPCYFCKKHYFSCFIFSVLNRNVGWANCPVELIIWNILDLLSSCYRKKVCIYQQSNRKIIGWKMKLYRT